MNGTTRHIPVGFTAVLLVAPLAALRAGDNKPAKPKVIFILADDKD
jgi:hypothetical protein